MKTHSSVEDICSPVSVVVVFVFLYSDVFIVRNFLLYQVTTVNNIFADCVLVVAMVSVEVVRLGLHAHTQSSV